MKNIRTAKWLMGFTMVLLTAFQVYWLHKLYVEEFQSLQKNTDVLFRETMYNLQVDRFKKDPSLGGLPGDNLFVVDMFNLLKKRIEDTSTGKQKNFIISINTKSDSQHSTLPGIMKDTTIRKVVTSKDADPSKIFESMHDPARKLDSIPVHIIDSAYALSLNKNRIAIGFTVNKSNDRVDPAPCTGYFCTGNVPMGIFGLVGYRASFDNPMVYLLKQIRNPVLLSMLLLALTFTSFLFIYRNLLAQRRLAIIKSDFINNITHELKTPIATVNVAIEALRSFGGLQDPERTKEYLDISALELQRLSLLVDKVLKLSMFESREITLQKETFNIAELVKEVLASMRLQMEKQHAVTDFTMTGTNFIITADKMHITSVLYNLLDNALKYSSKDPHINIQVVDRKNFLEIRIADNGIGIPAEHKEKIFEQFYRVPEGDRHNVKGYGLGLSYVKDIITRHHGFVEVESTPGKGSTFIIKVPFSEAASTRYDNNRVVYNKSIKL